MNKRESIECMAEGLRLQSRVARRTLPLGHEVQKMDTRLGFSVFNAGIAAQFDLHCFERGCQITPLPSPPPSPPPHKSVHSSYNKTIAWVGWGHFP